MLDSFAGSGTTAEAVLRSRDRQFVIVQQAFDSKEEELAKRNICREVVYRRVHTVAKEVDETFTYAQVGSALFGEYKDFGEELPPYEDIAKYIFYTETSREFPCATTKANSAWNKRIGRIGEYTGRSYYLLYSPNEREDFGLDRRFLNEVASADPNRELVVYCERLAVHQEELRRFERETGKKVRHMLVPFNLK